jgi:hypothetical protein
MDTEYKFDYEAVLDRIKQAMQFSTDAQVAEFIGMSPSGLGNRKRSGSIPFENICKACASRGVNIDWILTGTGAQFKTELQLSSRAVPYDANLMGEVAGAVWAALEDEGFAERESTIFASAKFRTALSTLIYNRVSQIADPEDRSAAIHEEAKIFALAEKFRLSSADPSARAFDVHSKKQEGSDGSV